MNIEPSVVTLSILFIVKFAFGFWLFKTGKPYSVIILTIHKLVSLFTALYIGLIARRVYLNEGLDAKSIIMVIITELLFIVAIGSGGYLSTDKPAPSVISILHKLTPFLSLISTIITGLLIL